MPETSETTAPETDALPAEPVPDTGVGVVTPDKVEPDYKADAAKWKTLARKHENEADKLRKQSMSDSDKAVAEAETRGRMAERIEAAKTIAVARAEAELRGRVDDPAEYVKVLNLGAFTDAEGNVDEAGIAGLVQQAVSVSSAPAPTDIGQGVRSKDAGPVQLTQGDLDGMRGDYERILAAKKSGLFNDLLGVTS